MPSTGRSVSPTLAAPGNVGAAVCGAGDVDQPPPSRAGARAKSVFWVAEG